MRGRGAMDGQAMPGTRSERSGWPMAPFPSP